MSSANDSLSSPAEQPGEEAALADLPTHPVGTLAVILIFALLFTLGWLALYFGVFLPRGATTL